MILFTPATSLTSGLGHLKRCISLAQVIRNKCSAKIIVQFKNHDSINLIEEFGLEAFPIETFDRISEEVEKFPQSVSAVVIDMADLKTRRRPDYIAHYVNALHSKSIRSIVIDSPAPESLFFEGMPKVDLVIRPYDVQNHYRPNWGHKICSGLEYVIIGQEYDDFVPSIYEKREKNIVITFGGSDPQNITEKICFFIKRTKYLEQFNFQIILGHSFNEHRKLKIREKYNNDKRFSFYENLPSLKHVFDNALVAVIGSGAATRYEASSCGTPALVLAIEPSHNSFLDYHQRYGSSLNLGYYEHLEENNFSEALFGLLCNASQRAEMSEKCRNVNFTGGLNRVSKQIEEIIF